MNNEDSRNISTKGRNLKIILVLSTSAIVTGILLFTFLHYYRWVFGHNVRLDGNKSAWLYIPTGATYPQVLDSLEKHHYLKSLKGFDWTAKRKDYPLRVRSGRYRLREGMNSNELVNLLRAGLQEPVTVTFQNIRTPQDFARLISRQIEADSAGLMRLISDPAYLAGFGVTPATFFTIIIPNTYEVYWNTPARRFLERMYSESKKFWNPERLKKAEEAGLTVAQVSTLASIVEKETYMNSEKPDIAGVYINRIRRGMPLQADPTVIYALNDYTIRRVLNTHTRVNSPYNTYLHTGLPPGPICVPSIASIDAVLNYRHHNYLYFCAKEDFSGYHNFSPTLQGHLANATRYQRALRKAGIR